jgi:hypothetical protein
VIGSGLLLAFLAPPQPGLAVCIRNEQPAAIRAELLHRSDDVRDAGPQMTIEAGQGRCARVSHEGDAPDGVSARVLLGRGQSTGAVCPEVEPRKAHVLYVVDARRCRVEAR